jgi:hypothetical protein
MAFSMSSHLALPHHHAPANHATLCLDAQVFGNLQHQRVAACKVPPPLKHMADTDSGDFVHSSLQGGPCVAQLNHMLVPRSPRAASCTTREPSAQKPLLSGCVQTSHPGVQRILQQKARQLSVHVQYHPGYFPLG